MRILNSRTRNRSIRFYCTNCGCKFEADEGEYGISGHESYVNNKLRSVEYTARCDCPVCGMLVTKRLI